MRRTIDVLNFARLQGVLFALLGVVAGIIYSVGGLVIDTLVTLGWVNTTETPGLSVGTILAMAALFIMPVVFYVCGLIAGLLEAIMFNFVSKYLPVPLYRVYRRKG